MNRVIKFRGKRVDNGTWIYGYYCNVPVGHPTITVDAGGTHQVGPESVGQFIGILSRDNSEIYENDVIRINYYPGNQPEGVVEFFQDLDQTEEQLAIRWVKWVLVDYKQRSGDDACETTYHFSSQELREIIGNTIDNPEMAAGAGL